MTASLVAEKMRSFASLLEGWDLTVDFQAPNIEVIENDLELASPGWTSLLVRRNPRVTSEAESLRNSHAICQPIR